MAVIKEDNGDAGADTYTQYTIALGDVFQGKLDPADDDDWVRVELSAGTIYDFTLIGIENELAGLALHDSSGNHMVSGNPIPSGAKLIFSPDVTGTYYIRAGNHDFAFTGEYELSLVENTIPTGSYDDIADYLTDGFWERSAFFVGPGGVLTANITALPEEGRQLARWAFEAWTNVTGIRFEFVEDNLADIMFDNEPAIAATGGPAAIRNGFIISSIVNIPPDFFAVSGTTIGDFSFVVILHEIGHALGLGHPGPYPTDFDNPVAYYGVETIFLVDSYQASIMSYISQASNTLIDASFANPVTPMIADIIAIQNLYGVPDNINAGDTVYGYQSNVDGYLDEFFRLWSGEDDPFSGIVVGDGTYSPFGKPRLADLDGDGDADLVIGEFNTLHYFENTGTLAEPVFTERTGTDNPLEEVSVLGYSAPTFGDLDGDGDPDLIVMDGRNEIAYFENTGTATAPDFTQRTGAASPLDGMDAGGYNTSTFSDLDGDGDLDLAVGNNDGGIHYFENTGTSVNPGFTQRTDSDNPFNNIDAGYDSAPVFIDIDDDKDVDLVVGNSGRDILYFENTGTLTEPGFTQRSDFDNPFHGADVGSYTAPEFADLNGDGKLDLVVGNVDSAILYLENTGAHANPEFSPQSFTLPTTFTIYDNGGNDTLDLRTDRQDQRIDLRPEGISDVYGLVGNMIIARDTWIENVIAGSGDDMVIGNDIANDLNGRDGNDRLWGNGGDDILEGGAGADQLDGGAGMDWVSYRDSDAAVTVNLADGTVSGGHAEGDVLTEIENVTGSGYDDVLTGNDAPNRLDGGAGADRLDGGAGVDWVAYLRSDTGVTVNLRDNTAAAGHAEGDVIDNVENIAGSLYRDVLTGDDGANELVGNAGDDIVEGGAGADRLDGGPGMDWLSYQGSDGAVSVRLYDGYAGRGHAEGDVINGFENLRGSVYADALAGDGSANRLAGGAGDDRLNGGSGDDVLEGGAGADRLDGGAGVDWLSYAGSDGAVSVRLYDEYTGRGHAEGDVISGFENLRGSAHADALAGDSSANRLEGGDGDDQLGGHGGDDVLEGGAGADRLDGGGGMDWASYLESGAGVTVNLLGRVATGGHAEGDVIDNVENIAGSLYRDVLTGDDGANELVGNAGDDTLRGNGGDDELRGNEGGDVLAGGAGADRLDGGSGSDTLSYSLSDAGVRVNLAENTAAGGHAEGDVFTSIEGVSGSDFADILRGDESTNNLQGYDGDDEIYGGEGDDFLTGGVGADRLEGGAGDDQLRGDWWDIEGSVDVFVFGAGHGDDIIFDFANHEDKIDLSAFGLSGYDELTVASTPGSVTIDLSEHGGGTILLQDFDIANLDATDFLF